MNDVNRALEEVLRLTEAVSRLSRERDDAVARIEQLEQQLAELEHLGSVKRATLASAASFYVGWENPIDAQYDDL